MPAKTNGVETTSGTKLTYAKCLPNLNTCLPQTKFADRKAAYPDREI
jgi:hypothetical protein